MSGVSKKGRVEYRPARVRLEVLHCMSRIVMNWGKWTGGKSGKSS